MSNFFKQFPIRGYKFKENDSVTIVVDIFKHVRLDSNVDDLNAYTYYEIMDGERPDQVSQKLYDTPDYYWTFFLINDNLTDGLHAWPKGYVELQNYISQKYTNHVLTSYINPGEIGTGHFVFDKFIIGETIQGNNSGSTATILERQGNMNRLILSNISGSFDNDDFITGLESGDTLLRDSTYDFSVEEEQVAAHHYENSDGIEVPRVEFNKAETSGPSPEFTEIPNRKYEVDLNDSKQNIRVLHSGVIENFARTYKKLING